MADLLSSDETQDFWVIKLGGSLLTLPRLAERLRSVVDQVATKPLLIVGGGEVADVVRRWDAAHRLSASAAHWLAVQAMDFNGRLLENLLPESIVVTSHQQAAKAWQTGKLPLLNVGKWLATDELRSQDSLPHSWDVTSDSIAAKIAIRFRAAGLLLLKSIDCPASDSDWRQAVDVYFPRLAQGISQLAWCNLRSPEGEIAKCPPPFLNGSEE